ncbi:MAG: hypothetical protein LAQ30_10110 [Acidobacteriia bacterium]|nr:hypothetical protein [Terriglobia bacterium]
MKKTIWIAVVFVAVVVGAVVYSTLGPQHRVTCRVCMSFDGRRDCRTASAETREEAVRAAVTNACAQLAGGVIQSSQCENTPPESIQTE